MIGAHADCWRSDWSVCGRSLLRLEQEHDARLSRHLARKKLWLVDRHFNVNFPCNGQNAGKLLKMQNALPVSGLCQVRRRACADRRHCLELFTASMRRHTQQRRGGGGLDNETPEACFLREEHSQGNNKQHGVSSKGCYPLCPPACLGMRAVDYCTYLTPPVPSSVLMLPCEMMMVPAETKKHPPGASPTRQALTGLS